MRRKLGNRGLLSSSTGLEQTLLAFADGALVYSALVLVAGTSIAQDNVGPQPMLGNSPESYQLGHLPPSEPATPANANPAAPSRFAVPLGSGGLNFNAGLKTEYIDNVFLTKNSPSDDFILIPECDLAAFFPVGRMNSVAIDVGLAYYEYLRHDQLNTGLPLINPNSDLTFNLRAGDFWFKFSEGFSYQQSPFYETGNEFFNLYNTALFQRYVNRVGGVVTWDQHDLVMTAGYFHENLWSETSLYNYIDHSSELFSADAMLAISQRVTVGLESAGSINDFFNSSSYDTWRARVGPALRINATEFIRIRAGGGYERIQYDSAAASSLGLTPENTYYAYVAIDHKINQFFTHSLAISHDNQLGFNAANLEGSHLTYSMTWAPRKQLSISPLVSIHRYDESFGSATANLYHEKFTYYLLGLAAHYELGPHWRATASWNYRLKDSDIPADGYAQNQVALELVYQF
jgi:hypothetical protein